jgi:hypothetical protein
MSDGRELAQRALDDMKARLDHARVWRVESKWFTKEDEPQIGFVKRSSTGVHRLVVEVEE